MLRGVGPENLDFALSIIPTSQVKNWELIDFLISRLQRHTFFADLNIWLQIQIMHLLEASLLLNRTLIYSIW